MINQESLFSKKNIYQDLAKFNNQLNKIFSCCFEIVKIIESRKTKDFNSELLEDFDLLVEEAEIYINALNQFKYNNFFDSSLNAILIVPLTIGESILYTLKCTQIYLKGN